MSVFPLSLGPVKRKTTNNLVGISKNLLSLSFVSEEKGVRRSGGWVVRG